MSQGQPPRQEGGPGSLGCHFQSWRQICNFYHYSTSETMSCYIIYRANLFIHSLLIQPQIFNRLQALCQAQCTLCEQNTGLGQSLKRFHVLLTNLSHFKQLPYFPCQNQGRRFRSSSSPTCVDPTLTPMLFPTLLFQPAVLSELDVVTSLLSLRQNHLWGLFNPGFWGLSPAFDSIGLV